MIFSSIIVPTININLNRNALWKFFAIELRLVKRELIITVGVSLNFKYINYKEKQYKIISS